MSLAKDVVNFTECMAELGVMYTREVVAKIGSVVLEALDCWGDDSIEDQTIRSRIWDD